MRIFLNTLLGLLFVVSVSAQDNDLERWFHNSPESGRTGISADKTYAELLKDKTSVPVVVAIIDSGVDINHEDLKDIIWINDDEVPGNGIDDDGNGYIDDTHGWNFIGGPNGMNVDQETYEVTRLYAKYKYKYENADPAKLNKKDKAEYEMFKKYEEEVNKERETAADGILAVAENESMILAAMEALGQKLAADSLDFNSDNIKNVKSDDSQVALGQNIAGRIIGSDPSIKSVDGLKKAVKEALEEEKNYYQNKLKYAYNPDYDSRKKIVKDNYANQNERIYGNNDVIGPDALHGTHVAGIVAAVRNNDIGMDGVADNVRIMSVRTVPNGDERDKDVANAIRYAVDNGASVINMSFGKGYSWNKDVVDDAVKYAEKHDVVLVHAAGNSSLDTDVENNFPNATYRKPGGWWIFNKNVDADPWIEVGALSHNTGKDQVATFSNYASENVDLFAPGEQIYATLPGNKYAYLRGTSMASPVVAGVVAVLRSYFPTLTANQVKDIIMDTTRPLDIEVLKPGTEEMVPFKTLSKSGGVVDMYKAVKKAMTVKGKKKIKKSGKKVRA